MLGNLESGDFYTDPVVGFRSWRMTNDEEPFLTGVVHQAIWPDIEDAEAKCFKTKTIEQPVFKRGHHPTTKSYKVPAHASLGVPIKDCQCGFYGYWEYEKMQRTGVVYQNHVNSVRGVCIGWGKTWLAEYGWRARFARPVALLDWPHRRNRLRDEFDPQIDGEAADFWNGQLHKISARYQVPVVRTSEALKLAVQEYLC